MTYTRECRDLTACPACGSGRLVSVLPGRLHLDGCVECLKFWERLPEGEPYTTDGEQLAFKVPCDNCAFRGKSPERSDRDGWEALMLSLAHGGEFYCHKAVPFTPGEAGEGKAFEFPRIETPREISLGGVTFSAPGGYDKDRMRMCRGWLNQFVAPNSKSCL